MRALGLFGCLALLVAGCDDEESLTPVPLSGTVVVTFNSGTSEAMGHDALPDDGYGTEQATWSDQWYGDGLAWQAVLEDTTRFFEGLDADIVSFQEIFYSGDCELIPEEARAGFVCETWQPGDLTVAQRVVGAGWQVACHLGKPDKCAAVRRSFGTFRGCDADLCLDGLAGAEVDGCGHGARIGRGVIDRVDGSTLTVVNVHGSSGLDEDDQLCRAAQFEQVFVDLGLGDGEPAANGERNLIMGDFNTDPGRWTDLPGAMVVNNHVGDGKPFHFVTEVGSAADPTYVLFNIDHVISDTFNGSCWAAGVTTGHPAVSDVLYFDHKPIVCRIN